MPVVLCICIVLLSCGADAFVAQRTSNPPHPRDLVGREFDARVVRVADGDTLEAMIAGQSQRVRIRLEGIDAPELGEPFSDEAVRFMRTLVAGAPVRISGRDLDNYGRLVARVSVGTVDASTALVRAGLACHAYARDAALAREESQARASSQGFWAVNAKKPACVERTAFSAREPSTTSPSASTRDVRALRGNVQSKLYHAPWCPNYNCRNCTRLFINEAEATMAGFSPAADCLKRP